MASSPRDDIVGLIYEASLAGDWSTPLRAIERHLDCRAMLMRHDAARGIEAPSGSRDRAVEIRYLDHYAPLNHAWPRLARHSPGEPATDTMLLDMEAHRRSLFFNEFLAPNGFVSMAGCMLLSTPGMTAGISLDRPATMPGFEKRDLRRLKPLMPHLARALRLQCRLGRAEQAAGDAWEMLDRLNVGVVVADAGARLVRANRAAEAMLRRDDGFALRQGRLVATEGPRTALLQAAIARRTKPQADGEQDGPLRLDRPSGRLPYLVDLVPLQGPPAWAGCTRSCCVLFVKDLDQAPQRPEGTLRRLFGLTEAETVVALQVGHGEGLSGIAARLEVGLATVRTHLAHGLDKTGLHRQAELARLIERLSAPVLGPPSPPPAAEGAASPPPMSARRARPPRAGAEAPYPS